MELSVGFDTGQKFTIYDQGFLLIMGSDGEDSWEDEGQLFGRHGLNIEGVVDWRNVDGDGLLTRKNKGLLGQFDIFDIVTCDDQVLVGLGDTIHDWMCWLGWAGLGWVGLVVVVGGVKVSDWELAAAFD